MCKETGYNVSFDSCHKLQKACCLSDMPCKMMMTMTGSSSSRISRKVIPVDMPSGDWASRSLICTLCHTLGMGVLGQGGLRAAVAFLLFLSPLQHLLGPSPRPQHLTLTLLSRCPSPLSFFPILFWDPIIL